MPGCGYEDFDLGLSTLPVRAPSLVDEDVLAPDLVDVSRDDKDDEEGHAAREEEEVQGILGKGGEEVVDHRADLSHGALPSRTRSPRP